MRVARLTRTPPGPAAVGRFAGGFAESHTSGACAVNSAGAVRSAAAVTFPALVADSIRPVADVVSRSVRSAGFAAALALVTTTTSEKPPCASAVSTRLTPGSTFRYVAVAPASTGAGSVPGQVSDSRRGPLDST